MIPTGDRVPGGPRVAHIPVIRFRPLVALLMGELSPFIVKLLAGSEPLEVHSGEPVQPSAPDALTYLSAAHGNTVAQVRVAVAAFDRAKSTPSVQGEPLDEAERWARLAYASGDDTAAFLLASILLFRAGVLRVLGLTRLASVDVAEAMNLLTYLADAGCEEAAAGIVKVGHILAQNGMVAATADQIYEREL